MTNWAEYYERAWKKRAELMGGFCRNETNLSRVFGKFDDFERRNQLVMLNDTGEMVYVPKPTPAVDKFFALDVTGLLMNASHGHDLIVEIGCGYGRRLFDLHNAGCDIPMLGMEPSGEGVKLAKYLRDFAGMQCPKLTIKEGDFTTKWDRPPEAKRTLVFTHYSAMYADPFPEDFFPHTIRQYGERVTFLAIEPDDNVSFWHALPDRALDWEYPNGANLIFMKDEKDE